MRWARDVMEVGPELDLIAGKKVHLQEMDYGWAVHISIEDVGGMKIAGSQYLDPNDGNWYLMDSKVRDHLTEAQLDNIVTQRLSVTDAKEQLRDFVRKWATKLH